MPRACAAAILASAVLLVAPGVANSQFDPTCGLSGGVLCGDPVPAPDPAEPAPTPTPEPSPPAPEDGDAGAEPTGKRPLRGRFTFALGVSGRPTYSGLGFNDLYVTSHGRGTGTLKAKPQRGRRVSRITSGSGRITLVHESLGFSDTYVLAVRGGGQMFDFEPRGIGRVASRVVLELVRSTDTACPPGRAGFMSMADSGILNADAVEIWVCGARWRWGRPIWNWTSPRPAQTDVAVAIEKR